MMMKNSEIDNLMAELEQMKTTDLSALAGNFSGSDSLNLSALGEHLIGQSIGSWHLEHLIGQGGMSFVYQVKRVIDGVELLGAMKIMATSGLDETASLRFIQERKILATFNHPNIPQIYDLGITEQGLMWTVMEWVEGLDLLTYLESVQLTQIQRIDLLLPICEALQYAHQRQIVHRDLKPQNILVNADGHVKLLDFGIAHIHDADQQLTQQGLLVGTPFYMSPEQAKGDGVIDARSDVFSFGVLMAQVLTGTLPFEADSMSATCQKIINEKPQLRWHGIQKKWRLIIEKCLFKDPSQRYQNIAELKADLIAAKQGKAIKAKPLTLFYRLSLLLQRHPKSAALIVTLLSLLWIMVMVNRQDAIQAQTQLRQTAEVIASSKDIEAQVREVHLLPLHKVQNSYQSIEQQFKPLLRQLKQTPESASAHTAVASAYLNLRDYEQANAYFKTAKQLGAEGETWVQGQAIAQFYHWKTAKEALKNIADPSARVKAAEKVDQTHLKPLMQHLQQGLEQGHLNHYVRGLMAYLEEDYPVAIEQMQQAIEKDAWFYEAYRMKAEIHFKQISKVYREQGLEAALVTLTKSKEALDQAIQIGRSDPYNYHSMCAYAGGEVQLLKLQGNQQEMSAAIQSGRDYCEKALLLDPDAQSPWINLNQLFLAEWSNPVGHSLAEVESAYKLALSNLHKGYEKHPEYDFFPLAMAKNQMKLALYLQTQEQSPLAAFTQAEQRISELLSKHPKHLRALTQKALLHAQLGQYYHEQTSQQEMAATNFQQAITANEMILSLKDTNVSRLNVGVVKGYLAEIAKQKHELEQAVRLMIESLNERWPLNEQYGHIEQANRWHLLQTNLDWVEAEGLSATQRKSLAEIFKQHWQTVCQSQTMDSNAETESLQHLKTQINQSPHKSLLDGDCK